MKRKFFTKIATLSAIIMIYSSCTDLTEESFDQLTADQLFKTEKDFKASLAAVYCDFYNTVWWDYNFSMEASTSISCIPQYPNDWRDGDTWLKIYTHQFSPSQGWPLEATYATLFKIVSDSNGLIETINNLVGGSEELKKSYLAEARLLRAIGYYLLMDTYGGVPLVTKALPDLANPPARSSRKEIFDFVEAELKAAYSDLNWGSSNYPRTSKGTAQTFLAKLYLNAPIYLGTGIDANSYYQKCIDACTDVIANGGYSLSPNYLDLFKAENLELAKKESIFMIDLEIIANNNTGGGIGWVRASLQNEVAVKIFNVVYGTWNGFVAIPDFVNTFEANDKRLQGLLLGPQIDPVTGVILKEKGVEVLGRNILNFTNASYGDGARFIKWQPDSKANGTAQRNNVPFIRYADVLLMKAEALIRKSGGPVAEADALVKQVKDRAYGSSQIVTNVSLNDLFKERCKEFYAEGGIIRTDEIRFGVWTKPKYFNGITMTPGESDNHTTVFPIPKKEMNANPNLVQNPGY